MNQQKNRIYIDETGNSDLESSDNPNHRFLSLTGVILNLNYIQEVVHPKIESLKVKYFNSHPDEPVIFHRKEMVNKKGIFCTLKEKSIENKFNQDLLNFLNEIDYKVITVLIDKYEHKKKYSVWKYDPYHYCLAVLLERYVRFLTQNNEVGDVMIESRGGKEDRRLKNSFSNLFTNGTDYITSEQIQRVLTSKQIKAKPKTANVSGLQIADLLAHPSRKEILLKKGFGLNDSYDFGNKIIDIMQKKYYSSGGKIDGYGKKVLP